MHTQADNPAPSRHTVSVGRKPRLRMLLALGIAGACGPRLAEDDGEERFRRCTSVLATGTMADGTPMRSDYGHDQPHQLCTCATDEEGSDFSEGGYREYINELGFEMCKDLAKEAELVTDNCQELYDRDSFSLTYGNGPDPDKPPPSCSENEAAGCGG